MAEQVDGLPYTTTLLYLPESFTGGRIYQIQYGRRFTFAGAGQQSSYLRLNRQTYQTGSLDVLVNNTGMASGNLNLCLDIGNDGTCDFSQNGTTSFPTTLSPTGLQSAFNSYLSGQSSIPWGSPVDVPVRVQVDRQADVMLTNLALTTSGGKTRFLRLPARSYTNLAFSLKFTQPGVPSGPLSFTVDVGADGSIDWSYSSNPSFPAVVWSPDLSAAFNAYLAGRSGDVDVPLRIVPSPFLDTALDGFRATPSTRPDLVAGPGDIGFGSGSPVEGDVVTATAAIHNTGGAASGPVAASFFATAPAWGETYVGTAFVPDVPAGGTSPAVIAWNTLGFTGTIPVRVVIDPFNRVAESTETNNTASISATIRTRPDLLFPSFTLSDDEPVVGKEVTVTLALRNAGQAGADAETVALYQGNPNAGGTPLGDDARSPLPGENESTVTFTWTSTTTGQYRLFARADRDGQVNESDEGNNLAWRDVYVGFRGPLLLDSGAEGTDPAYSRALGYGAVDEGQADTTGSCGSEASQTFRRDPGGRVVYQFDHLQPGHFYHLDLTLNLCGAAGRQESVYVDGNLVGGPEDLGDGKMHRLSLRLDPALYADRTISATVETSGLGGAIVSEVNLHDVDYRYSDSGAAGDLPYTPERGWGCLPGSVARTQWGTLPFQSLRENQTGNSVGYRYDALDPAKRYALRLVFWQNTGASVVQKVQVDGADAGSSLTLASGTLSSISVDVPPSAYADGSIVASIVRMDAGTSAMVNEIALEELTLVTPTTCRAAVTPYFTEAYGGVTLNGQPAPAGTVVEAVSPRGDAVGCFTIGSAGRYGFMRIYGEDTTASPVLPGMRDGEPVAFRVDGLPAVATPLLRWHEDRASHRVDLNAAPLEGQVIPLLVEWNLISTRVEPPLPLVDRVLKPIDGRYDRALGETGAYAPELEDVYNTLKELHTKQAYYLRLTGDTSANLLIEGVSQPADTPIALHGGWNWLGYLPAAGQPITQALQSIDGAYQRVLSLEETYDVSLPEWSTLTELEPGKGYLIYMSAPVTLTYPTGAMALSQPRPAGARRAPACAGLRPTPFATLVYGSLSLNGAPAPAGTPVEVLTPRGEVAGCFAVERDGQYGLMQVYGGDPTATPPIPGFAAGEPLHFRVYGAEFTPDEPLAWQDDKAPHRVDVAVTGALPFKSYLPFLHVR